MGTHPIFESDFDCLTDEWKLCVYGDSVVFRLCHGQIGTGKNREESTRDKNPSRPNRAIEHQRAGKRRRVSLPRLCHPGGGGGTSGVYGCGTVGSQPIRSTQAGFWPKGEF